MNVKLPPEEVAKNRRQTAAILAISVAKDRRQKMAVLAQWKAEVEESRRERGSAAATYTDLPELLHWNETEQMWKPHLTKKRSSIPTLNVELKPVGDKERRTLMLERLSWDERCNTIACLSKVWLNPPWLNHPERPKVYRRLQGNPHLGPLKVDYNEKIPEVDWVD